jgi:hypothetical protein
MNKIKAVAGLMGLSGELFVLVVSNIVSPRDDHHVKLEDIDARATEFRRTLGYKEP